MSNGDAADRGPLVLAVTVAVTVCSSVFVALRIISRTAIVKKVGIDDYFIIGAWLITFGLSFSICYGTKFGLGRHEWNVPSEWERSLKETQYAFSVLYNPALMTTKTSILIFFLSLSESHIIFRWATWATIAVVNAAGLALTFLNAFQCRPVDAVFETPTPDWASCTSIVTIYLSSAPVNIITDLAIFFLPMPILTGMRLPKKQKIILIITFSFGIFVAVVDVVRIAYLQTAAFNRLHSLQNSGEHNESDRDDFSWYASLSFMWSAVEVNVGIMVACVPALKPLASKFVPSFIRSTDDERTSYGNTIGSPALANGDSPTFTFDSDALARPKSIHANGRTSQNGSDRSRDSDEQIGALAFLTSPSTGNFPDPGSPKAPPRGQTLAERGRAGSVAFFDFVNTGQKKSMVRMSTRESYFPVAMVTTLFFIWGFAYGLLDTLNAQFQIVAHMSSTQTIGIHSSYYVGYFVAPLTFGRIVLNKWGFKSCYSVGLSIYACGTLLFWPAAVLTSFPAFLVSNFTVGLGLSTLEVAANPFIFLCGPPQHAEIRLNLSQGVQAVGSILSPLLARKVLFKSVTNAPSLIDVQWTYLGISFFTILLAVVWYYVPLPEASDDELEEACRYPDHASFSSPPQKVNLATMFRGARSPAKHTRTLTLSIAIAVFSMFCYCGAQESVNTSFLTYLSVSPRQMDPVNTQAIGHTVFAASRFIGAIVNSIIKPRAQLLYCYIGAIVCSAVAIGHYSSDSAPTALLICIYFFEGPLFPLIFALGLRGQGRRTKEASALLTAAISGGAVFPPILNAVQIGQGVHVGYAVVTAAFVAGTVMPIWLFACRDAKELVDPYRHDEALLRRWRGSEAALRNSKAHRHRRRLLQLQQQHHEQRYQQRKRESGDEKRHSWRRATAIVRDEIGRDRDKEMQRASRVDSGIVESSQDPRIRWPSSPLTLSSPTFANGPSSPREFPDSSNSNGPSSPQLRDSGGLLGYSAQRTSTLPALDEEEDVRMWQARVGIGTNDDGSPSPGGRGTPRAGGAGSGSEDEAP